MRKEDTDPFAYIESAFLEAPVEEAEEIETPTKSESAMDAPQPNEPTRSLVDAIRNASKAAVGMPEQTKEPIPPKPKPKAKVSATTATKTKAKPAPKPVGEPIKVRLKKTEMSAPRPRKRRSPSKSAPISSDLEQVMQLVPKNLKFLSTVYDDDVTQKYYSTQFREPREELIRRLVDPELSLEDTARLLGVCPATVRRYTNRGWLEHHRTKGNQRRFRLSGIVAFVESHGRNPE